MSNRTLIYARVSTEDQVEKYGLPAQLRACRDLAVTRSFSVLEEITDDGITGAILERSGLDRLRARVAAGEADIVLMYDADRLSRDLGHLIALKREIEKRARLEFVTGRFEDSASGRLFFHLKGSFAEYEREVIRERTMRGQRERAQSGLLVGGRVPYGYSYDAGALAIAEQQAATVRKVFAWYRGGLSIRSIAAKLREEGISTWGGRPWGHTSVRWILGNETYAGTCYWGARYRDGKVLYFQPRESRIALAVPALIDRDLWDQVQARLAEYEDRRGRVSDRFLLSGLLRCGCGRRMHGDFNRRRSYASYRCVGRDRERNGIACRRAVNGGQLDQAVWSEVARVFGGDGEELCRMLAEHQASLRKADSGRPDQVKAQLARWQRREQAAMELLLDPDLAAERAAIKAQYQQARTGRVKAEAELAQIAAAGGGDLPSATWVRRMAAELREYIAGLSETAERREVVRRLSSGVEWDGEQALIRCFIGPQTSSLSKRSGLFPSADSFRVFELTLTARLAA